MNPSQTEKKSKWTYARWIVPSIILLIFLMATLFSFSKKMENASRERALDRIGRHAVYVAGYYEGLYTALSDSAMSIADAFMLISTQDLFGDRSLNAISSIKKEFDLEKVYIIRCDLTAMDDEGKEYTQIEDYPGINDLIEAKEQNIITVNPDGVPVMLFSAPIRTHQEWNGNIIYVYRPHILEDKIGSTTYSYALSFSDGTIAETAGVKSNLFVTGENLLKALDKATFIKGGKTSISVGVESGRNGMVSIKHDGENQIKYIAYQPINGFNSSVLVEVGENQIHRSVENDNKDTKELIVKIVISISIFILLMVMIYVINRINYIKQNKELKNKAETDLLTDLYNKVSTEQKITEYINTVGNSSLCMMCVLDIDNFKKINDTMGHAFGDEVIATLGKKIKAEFRVSDIVGRIGGDEFVIFLKDLKSEDIINREASRISRFFKDFQVGDYTKYSPTVSIGAAIYPRDASDYESLYKSADTALYKAKKRGKNQLAFYREMSEEAQ